MCTQSLNRKRRRWLLVATVIARLCWVAPVIAARWNQDSVSPPARPSRQLAPVIAAPTDVCAPTMFAIVGDYGVAAQPAIEVATLIASWSPDFVVTTGDNNYDRGEWQTIDRHIGQHYHAFIAPYVGNRGPGAATNRFFPVLGNHDWDTDNAKAYLDYFALPGNERYYDVQWGPVHLFALDSDPREPDGIDATSAQAAWLRQTLQASPAPWKLVFMHHPPYSSGQEHGDTPALQWPYREWGASAVIAGHEHFYERLDIDGAPYIVNGSGGRSLYPFKAPRAESRARFATDYGAMRVEAGPTTITFEFITRAGARIDRHSITSPAPPSCPIAR